MKRARPLHLVPIPDDGPADAAAVSLEPAALFRRYAAYVATCAHRLLGADDELDDVVQEVFLVALRGLRGLRDPEAIRGWLATVTVRRAGP